jgi:hypothetical protein
MKYVTVGNVAGDYVLVCELAANKETGVHSCFSPRPQRNYLRKLEMAHQRCEIAYEPGVHARFGL